MTRQSDMTRRIATSSTDAAAGYATAAVAAYVDMASQVMGFWANAFDTATNGAKEPKSWYRHPDAPVQPSLPFGQMPWMPGGAAYNGLPMVNPFALWIKAWPLQGNPAAWPMAFAMMGMGMTRSVAMPLAEANVAAMDAATAAGQVIDDSFSSYRSAGGHASAQIRFDPIKSMAALAPMALPFVTPWLSAMTNAPRTF